MNRAKNDPTNHSSWIREIGYCCSLCIGRRAGISGGSIGRCGSFGLRINRVSGRRGAGGPGWNVKKLSNVYIIIGQTVGTLDICIRNAICLAKVIKGISLLNCVDYPCRWRTARNWSMRWLRREVNNQSS